MKANERKKRRAMQAGLGASTIPNILLHKDLHDDDAVPGAWAFPWRGVDGLDEVGEPSLLVWRLHRSACAKVCRDGE